MILFLEFYNRYIQIKEEENKQDEKSGEKRINELIAVKSDRAEKKAQQNTHCLQHCLIHFLF